MKQQTEPVLRENSSLQSAPQKIEFYQGIIPHPDLMEKYRQIDPELPMRIVQWTEDEGRHRRKLETKVIQHSYNTIIWGYLLGFLCVGLIAMLCYFFMINGNPKEGMWIACIIIVALSIVFVLRKIPKVGKPEE